MVKKLLLPQEIETFYVLPSIRRHMAGFMKKQGLKQKEIAKIFGMRDAAVSQYLSNKRGCKLDLDNSILGEIKKSSKRVQNSAGMIKETQRIIKIIRKKRLLCRFCHEFGNVPKGCNPKLMGC